MAKKQMKVRFPVLTVLLLFGTLVLGGIAGAFFYATGNAIINSPYMVMISHTEYRFNEPGQIVARLVDFQGNPVVTTNCTATILYPNKTIFVNAALMTDTGNIAGDHYYNFNTPSAGPEGVYEYQAVCYYSPNKNASVTNSFHLSSVFTSVLGNQTLIENSLTSIQGNLTATQNTLAGVASNLSAMNSTLSGQMTSLSNQLNTNVSSLMSQMNNNITAVQNQLNTNISSVLLGIQSINTSLQNINVTVNLTPVYDAINALNATMISQFNLVNQNLGGNFTLVNQNLGGNFSVMTTDLVQINTTANNIYTLLETVNTTTQNTYTYMTTTLAGNVNNILTDLGVINATVNRIEVNTQEINTTTQTILTNQQNQVQMSVFSG